jgi:hypothetical protein
VEHWEGMSELTRRPVGEEGGDEAEDTESERVLVGVGDDMVSLFLEKVLDSM